MNRRSHGPHPGEPVFKSRGGGATWSQQLKVSELTHPES
jgi:hypothetical protein